MQIKVQISKNANSKVDFSIIWNNGPDRLESIMFDITEKKIDNPHSHLQICYSL